MQIDMIENENKLMKIAKCLRDEYIRKDQK